MKKIIQIIFLLLSGFSAFASEKVSMFIDISGSINSNLPEMQKYVTEEYLPNLKPDSDIEIYKFYGKLRKPPIYEGNLETETKINWAKHQVNALTANGPWTNISQVLDYIKASCTNYGDKFVIFTDGIQELEDGSDNYELTDEMVKSKLGKNARLVKMGNWKTVEYTYEEEIPVVQNIEITVPEINQVSRAKPIEVVTENQQKENKSGNWKWLLWLLIALAIIALVVIAFFILRTALPVIVSGLASLGGILGSVAAFSVSSLVPDFVAIGGGIITVIAFFRSLGGGIKSFKILSTDKNLNMYIKQFPNEARQSFKKGVKDGSIDIDEIENARKHFLNSKTMNVEKEILRIKNDYKQKTSKLNKSILSDEERKLLKRTSDAKANRANIKNLVLKRLNKEEWDDECVPLFISILKEANDIESLDILSDGGKSEFHWIAQNWHARAEKGNHEFIGTQEWWRFCYNQNLTPADVYVLSRLTPKWNLSTKATVFSNGESHYQGGSKIFREYHKVGEILSENCKSANEFIKNRQLQNEKYLSQPSYEASQGRLAEAFKKV